MAGSVASAREAAALRAEHGPGFAIVVPGIRPAGSTRDDQARTARPAEAVSAGAPALVVGRPITEAADPLAAARAIAREIAAGAGGRRRRMADAAPAVRMPVRESARRARHPRADPPLVRGVWAPATARGGNGGRER